MQFKDLLKLSHQLVIFCCAPYFDKLLNCLIEYLYHKVHHSFITDESYSSIICVSERCCRWCYNCSRKLQESQLPASGQNESIFYTKCTIDHYHYTTYNYNFIVYNLAWASQTGWVFFACDRTCSCAAREGRQHPEVSSWV